MSDYATLLRHNTAERLPTPGLGLISCIVYSRPYILYCIYQALHLVLYTIDLTSCIVQARPYILYCIQQTLHLVFYRLGLTSCIRYTLNLVQTRPCILYTLGLTPCILYTRPYILYVNSRPYFLYCIHQALRLFFSRNSNLNVFIQSILLR